MDIETARIATGRRVVCAWVIDNHAFAETVKPGAPDTPAIYLDNEWLEILETVDNGETWTVAECAFPLMDIFA